MGSVKRKRLEQRIEKRTDMGSETHQRRVKRTRSKIDATGFKRIRRKISRRKGPKNKGSKRGAKKLRKRRRTPRRKRQWKEQRGNRDKVDLFLTRHMNSNTIMFRLSLIWTLNLANMTKVFIN